MDRIIRKQTCWLIALLGMLLAISAFVLPAQNAHAANTTMGSATKMAQGTTYSGDLKSDRYYRIDIPDKGILSLTLGKKNDSYTEPYYARKVCVYKYTNKLETIFSTPFGNGIQLDNSFSKWNIPIGVEKGSYFVKLSNDLAWQTNLTYTAKYTFTKSANWETEGNDTIDTADNLTLGKATQGTIPSSEDSDWYKVSIPTTGWYNITLGRNSNAERFSWVQSMYKSTDTSLENNLLKDGNNINDWKLRTYNTGSGKVSKQIKLSKGTYFTRVETYTLLAEGMISKYSLCISKAPAPASTKISKSKAGKKSFKVYWNKKSSISKYEVRVSTKKSMSGSHYYTVSKSKSSLNVKKLTAKRRYEQDKPLKRHKKYYVQIRSIKTMDTPSRYSWDRYQDVKSSWSKVKTVKTK